MLSKLTRILLAICTAFVFTGQMEAAAEHCARLALAAEHQAAEHEAAQHAVKAETPPCHDGKPAAETKTAHHPTHSQQSADHCECIAALKMCASLPAADRFTKHRAVCLGNCNRGPLPLHRARARLAPSTRLT
jgi:hypothetical protein